MFARNFTLILIFLLFIFFWFLLLKVYLQLSANKTTSFSFVSLRLICLFLFCLLFILFLFLLFFSFFFFLFFSFSFFFPFHSSSSNQQRQLVAVVGLIDEVLKQQRVLDAPAQKLLLSLVLQTTSGDSAGMCIIIYAYIQTPTRGQKTNKQNNKNINTEQSIYTV